MASKTVTVRLEEGVYGVLEEMAKNRGVGLSAYLRLSLSHFAEKVGVHGVVHSEEKRVYSLHDLQDYKFCQEHKGETVGVRKGKEVIKVKVREIDSDGNIVPEV